MEKTVKTASKKYSYAFGRRKTSIATVRLFEGKGDSLINGRKVSDVYKVKSYIKKLYRPLEVTEKLTGFYFEAKAKGGGASGQIDATTLALSRALVKFDKSFRPSLKKAKLLSVDSRIVERKKAGFKKARKKQQYSKR